LPARKLKWGFDMQTTVTLFLLSAAITAFFYYIHLERREMRRAIHTLEATRDVLETHATLLRSLLTIAQRERDEASAALEQANTELARLHCSDMSRAEARRWLSSHVARRSVSEN